MSKKQDLAGPGVQPAGRSHVDAGSADAIRAQLERILVSAPFRHSRRCMALLGHVTQSALTGDTQGLHERPLGVAVFGRHADYDTNADPIIRTTAGEIRKRLAQYYQEPGHEGELRILLPPGSYVPDFHDAPAPPLGQRARRRILWPNVAVLTALAGAAAVAAAWSNLSRSSGLFEEFWAPVLSSGGPVVICAAQPQPLNGSPPDSDKHVAIHDAVLLSRLAAFFEVRGRQHDVRPAAETDLARLRDGPAMLVGTFTEQWAAQLSDGLRFTLERDPAGVRVRDRWRLGADARNVEAATPFWTQTGDYAIISRLPAPATGKPVIMISSVSRSGANVAAEFLTHPEYLSQALMDGPANWSRQDLQIVIATKLLGDRRGVPTVLAVHFQSSTRGVAHLSRISM